MRQRGSDSAASDQRWRYVFGLTVRTSVRARARTGCSPLARLATCQPPIAQAWSVRPRLLLSSACATTIAREPPQEHRGVSKVAVKSGSPVNKHCCQIS
jgi:hypothetical protein